MTQMTSSMPEGSLSVSWPTQAALVNHEGQRKKQRPLIRPFFSIPKGTLNKLPLSLATMVGEEEVDWRYGIPVTFQKREDHGGAAVTASGSSLRSPINTAAAAAAAKAATSASKVQFFHGENFSEILLYIF